MSKEQIKSTLTRQKRCLELIVNFQANNSKQKAASAMTEQDYQARLHLLETYWSEFRERDYQLAAFCDDLKERSYFKQGFFDSALTAYVAARSWLLESIPTVRTNPSTAGGQPPAPVNPVASLQASLERVKLPKFSSNQREWQIFKSKFQSLVLNDTSMPNIIKFEHLSTALEGEAAARLKSFDVEADNFMSAWQALCSRYDNPILRFSAHFNALVRLPAASYESGEHLSQLLNTATESINVFTRLKLPVEHWDMVFIQLVENKLPQNIRLEWARSLKKSSSSEFPKFKEFKLFLEDRIQSLDIVEGEDTHDLKSEPGGREKPQSKGGGSNITKKSKSVGPKGVAAHVSTQGPGKQKNDICSFCQGTHYINLCKKFTSLSPAKRMEHVVGAKLCLNCLSARHASDSCTSKGSCYVCGRKHHSKLHMDDCGASSKGLVSGSEVQRTNAHLASSHREVLEGFCNKQLLATAIVFLESKEGGQVTARALLDSCAERSFISENMAQALALKKKSVTVAVSGLSGTTTTVARGQVSLRLRSPNNSDFCLDFSALVVKRVSNLLPREKITSKDWTHLQGLQLADPHFGQPSRVDCILSSAVYGAVILPEIRRCSSSPWAPVAVSTVFGWILMGNAGPEDAGLSAEVHYLAVDQELSQAVTRFWECEEVPHEPFMSAQDQECLKHFKQTYRRNQEGRFVVKLPFSKEPAFVGTDRIAKACMSRLERRFEKQPEVAAAYHAFMREYLDLGHMELLPEEDRDEVSGYFLPHHPVFKQDGSRKIRVVFNGSQKDEVGNSLNSSLHAGPKLQEDIIMTVIIRWCFFKHVFVCDIVKNFRQMLVDPADTRWQLIYWRFDPRQALQAWRLLTVTYGTASAPFLANACLLELADAVESTHGLASVLLRRHRYVDDFLAGGDTLEEAKRAQTQLADALNSAGMSLDKYSGNHGLLAQSRVFEGHRELREREVVSTLGLRWSSSEDSFHFKVKMPATAPATTKRSILSEVAKLFDPVGYLSPIIVRAKMLIQVLWLQGIDWDAEVPDCLRGTWLEYRQQLLEIEDIRIPRWYGASRERAWHLHGFCDASERAFAAVIFVVVPDSERAPRLLVAKSKVAPLKVVSVPKLELCGAALLANLMSRVLSQLDGAPEEIHCWSDSRVVLAWLRSPPSRWKPYVANRVSDILTLLPSAAWHHVPSQDNPSDLATRGCTPSQLRDSTLWWCGPAWLRQGRSFWPADSAEETTQLEARRRVEIWLSHESCSWSEWFDRFSSFDRLVAVLTYCFRWRSNTFAPVGARRMGFLSAAELSHASTVLFRLTQTESFADEFRRLSTAQELPLKHPLRRLLPFVGADGLLRVGGRLDNSYLSETEKHPIILPKSHRVTLLLIRKAHLCTLHGGATAVQGYLARGYWIIQGRNVIRREVRNCVTCARHNARTLEQRMGPLPAIRTRPARPFLHSGVDFAGHFWIKSSAGRGQKAFKGYVAVFICLVVKAVHLELVSDLTSSAFLAAFRRFSARRGLCKVIYSDNGTTFKGSESELRRYFSEASAAGQLIASTVARDGVEWRFIPPRAPNFGGIWEANVKSLKRHLYRVVGEVKMTFEQFATLLAEIEACLNSRPLGALSSNATDVSAITPGHFLVGGPLLSPPEPCLVVNETLSLCSRWQHV